jgi:hypothetical protein
MILLLTRFMLIHLLLYSSYFGGMVHSRYCQFMIIGGNVS